MIRPGETHCELPRQSTASLEKKAKAWGETYGRLAASCRTHDSIGSSGLRSEGSVERMRGVSNGRERANATKTYAMIASEESCRESYSTEGT